MHRFHIRRGGNFVNLMPKWQADRAGNEERRAKRFDCNLRATALINQVNFFCIVTNISMSGAALSEKGFCKLQAEDHVKLMVQSLDALSGTVRWIGQTGFGIEFDEASRRAPHLINFINELGAKSRMKCAF